MIIDCSDLNEEIRELGIRYERLYINNSCFDMFFGKIKRKFVVSNDCNINIKLKDVEDSTIIIFDGTCPDNNTLKWLVNNNKNKRLIFYYWNPVHTSINPNFIPKEYEKWSYSPQDCMKYSLKYNSTFYFNSFVFDRDTSIQQDVFFVGKNKGRKNSLLKLKKELKKMGLSSEFIITATHPRIQKIGYSKKLSYEAVLLKIQSSKALVDYYRDNQAGLSLRVMESVFFEKKLITNNKSIVKYDFYEPQNIFVLGQDKMENLNNFINEPYKAISKEIRDYYLFQNWLDRFGE